MWDVKFVVIVSVLMFSIIRLPDGFVCLSFSLMPHFQCLEYGLLLMAIRNHDSVVFIETLRENI
jgi:hypothetical protein